MRRAARNAHKTAQRHSWVLMADRPLCNGELITGPGWAVSPERLSSRQMWGKYRTSQRDGSVADPNEKDGVLPMATGGQRRISFRMDQENPERVPRSNGRSGARDSSSRAVDVSCVLWHFPGAKRPLDDSFPLTVSNAPPLKDVFFLFA